MDIPLPADVPKVHGSYCVALLSPQDPDYGKELSVEMVCGRIEDPRMRRVAQQIAERVLPVTSNPYISDGCGEFGDRSIWLGIPVDDAEAVSYFDKLVKRSELGDTAEED